MLTERRFCSLGRYDGGIVQEEASLLRSLGKSSAWEKVSRLRRQRRVQNAATLGLVILGPMLAFLTFLVLGPLDSSGNDAALRGVLLADLVYILVVAALVLGRVAQMIAARRARSAGSRLHLRLTGVFALLALIPTVLVAIFAGLTINMGVEGWFSDRVRQVVGNSLAAAEAYQDEQTRDLTQDTLALARYLTRARQQNFFLSNGDLRQLLTQGQAQVQRGLREAFVINGNAEIEARGERSYLFDFEPPSAAQIKQAADGETVLIKDWDNNEFRVLLSLNGFVDRYLYVSRNVDGDILNLLDDTQKSALFYQQLETDRGRRLFEFGLIYLGFALVLILASIWLGLWFAERLSRPVGRLAGAAQRVGTGDLDVQVIEEEGDDEIAMLGRYFNQMTRQLKGQRDTLLDNNRQIERRRRLFDSVLASVTSGVIGLDPEGNIAFVNRSAQRLLALGPSGVPQALAVSVPEFGALLSRLRQSRAEVAQEEIKLTRSGHLENLLVRLSTRRNDDGTLEGYVIAFDDVTDLVAAQRMAAWGDVARRIAHEIKNPLTPIQLSAERLKRKFLPKVGEDGDSLEQMTEVIIRQTNDLRRIVDEFSKFARMPEPERRELDLTKLVSDAVLLQQSGQPDVEIRSELPDRSIMAELDGTMISQALTNLIKNAGEAIETRQEGGDTGFAPQIRVRMQVTDGTAQIEIADNGVGLPEDRARLFEPYVTTRDKGTGLGLPIVKKIIEEHGGTLSLVDAEMFEEGAHQGALAKVSLPITSVEVTGIEQEMAG